MFAFRRVGHLLTGPYDRYQGRSGRQRGAPVRALTAAAAAEQCPEQGVVFYVGLWELEGRQGAFPDQV